ncbi:CPBP family intramembrane metalloprotease [Microbulbifer agarilyticus]|uniref:CPBP family intramembrane glutamic endopeptidase n=1 Tax=Microbulbifer agarilyticus TaxID=260552 RepID=UPI001C96C444|nr:type II CAAX endopeptidase family protein [Microbulbifer agarilyticus]MBY6211898.1 CPBP family intramembrane metalloprotease [Microbulbifer agarilyticus]
MLGVIVALLLSWAILHRIAGEPITVLGITPTWKRCGEFLLGMGFMAAVAVINFIWQAHFKQISYTINPEYSLLDSLRGSFWVFRSVLFEELVFRGAILYLLIRYVGLIKACLLSSAMFGVYHWFSYEVFGAHLVLMIYIFLVTGMGGWMFAFAYAKTKSLFAPVGLHLGWNLVTAIVFSSGPLGNQWLIQQGETVHTSDWITLIFFSLQAIVAPGLVTLYLLARYKSVECNAAALVR